MAGSATAGAAALAAALLLNAAAPVPLEIKAPLMAHQGDVVRAKLPANGHDLKLDGRAVPLEADGRFMIGIDRDAGPAALLTWITADGRTARWPVSVEPRPWDIDVLPARLAYNGPPNPEYDAMREAEVALIRTARTEISPWPFWSATVKMPVTGRISGVYGSQRVYGDKPAAPHAGLDIAAPAGTPIKAPIPGIVRLAQGPFTLEGNVIILDHGRGLYSSYLHLSRIDVKPGQIIRQGDIMGAIGTTGRSTGPHLHWAMTWHGVRVDPASMLQPGTLRPPGTLPEAKANS